MRTRFIIVLLASTCLGACLIEPMTFTPLADDTAMPDASGDEVCGDGTRQGTEVCDRSDLGGSDCTTLGSFNAGTLGCTKSCDAFDTSGSGAAPTVPSLRAPMNDSYGGNPSIAGSRRPHFVWGPSSVDGGAEITYELQFSTDATFGAGVTTVPTIMTSHQPAVDLAVSPTAPVGARYYWRVRACADGFCSLNTTTWWVNVGRSDRDFNGDGYADIVVGAPYNDAAGIDAGRVYVYYGGAGATFEVVPNGTLTGAAAGEYFGSSVASAGDVNGDGFVDIIVGAFGSDAGGAESGRAYVYLGGPGIAFDPVADGTFTGAAGGDHFGCSVASAGDVNGDGFGDVVVGADRNDAAGGDAGRVYLYRGGTGATVDVVADGTLSGAAVTDFFGYAVGSAGDVNGDGFADIVVGAVGNDAAGAGAGRAYIYLGGQSDTFEGVADGTLSGAAAGDLSGSSVASAGDVNGDGFADVVVGSSGAATGRADIYFGGAGSTFDPGSDGILVGAVADDRFGNSVSGGGDLNGDGFDDLVVGASRNDAGGSDAGRAYAYLGGSGASFDGSADGTFTGAAADDYFGSSVASAGDLNADGFGDIVVGAALNDSGGAGAGRAYVYFGRDGFTIDPTTDGALTGADGDNFGHSVASAGVGWSWDVNYLEEDDSGPLGRPWLSSGGFSCQLPNPGA